MLHGLSKIADWLKPKCALGGAIRKSGWTTPKWRYFGELLEVKIADPRAPVETAVCIIVFGGVPEGAVVHWINGH
jgi:hypothetical protein